MTILEVRDVSKVFPVSGRSEPGLGVSALHDVSLTVQEREVLGIVGESGSGKSTLARIVCGLEKPTSGEVLFEGVDIARLSRRDLRRLRRKIQIVFQDPNSAMDPRMKVGSIIKEVWRVHPGLVSRSDERTKLMEVLELVGLRPDHADRYSHQLSGGERQRIAIARALALNPTLLICDEAVSALDASVQAQILNLLADIKDELGLAMMFITHDLSVVRQISDRIAVMYFGEVIETGTEDQVCDTASHPYTQALLSAAHLGTGTRPNRIVLSGEPPDPSDPPFGCRFQHRCWKVQSKCIDEHPTLEIVHADHPAACFYAEIPDPLLAGTAPE